MECSRRRGGALPGLELGTDDLHSVFADSQYLKPTHVDVLESR
jgi:hypothetical protein